MKRRSISIPVYIILGLALVGLLSQLFTNTVSFINSIFISIGIGVALFSIFYFLFIRKRNSSNEMKKYRQAVKQSKAKYQRHQANKPAAVKGQSTISQQRKKRLKRAPHLRVIDGNKSTKKKDRASF
ncbi:SA1362 family protein [Virgibacillus proomii]|jgi:uncharacterized membrane protein YgaE (UPF0421/DUF939 family)|uniref:SA1362 family protein n=1 Tax=Virgibacillus proomii TaxID=84407 RepID=UPI0009858B7F|nr:SA1362 family protein [Virgibacillus proomii]